MPSFEHYSASLPAEPASSFHENPASAYYHNTYPFDHTASNTDQVTNWPFNLNETHPHTNYGSWFTTTSNPTNDAQTISTSPYQTSSFPTTVIDSITDLVTRTYTPSTSCSNPIASTSSGFQKGDPLGSEKPYKCLDKNCKKKTSFKRGDELIRHRRILSGERPYSCPVCKRGFSRSDHLTTHMRTHTGEKPYTCSECGKRFARSDECKRHTRVHSKQNLKLQKTPNGHKTGAETNVYSKRKDQATKKSSKKISSIHHRSIESNQQFTYPFTDDQQAISSLPITSTMSSVIVSTFLPAVTTCSSSTSLPSSTTPAESNLAINLADISANRAFSTIGRQQLSSCLTSGLSLPVDNSTITNQFTATNPIVATQQQISQPTTSYDPGNLSFTSTIQSATSFTNQSLIRDSAFAYNSNQPNLSQSQPSERFGASFYLNSNVAYNYEPTSSSTASNFSQIVNTSVSGMSSNLPSTQPNTTEASSNTSSNVCLLNFNDLGMDLLDHPYNFN